MPPMVSRISARVNWASDETPTKAAVSFGALKVNTPTELAPLKRVTVKVESINVALTFGSNWGSTKSKPKAKTGVARETLIDSIPLKPSSLPGRRALYSVNTRDWGLAKALKVTAPTVTGPSPTEPRAGNGPVSSVAPVVVRKLTLSEKVVMAACVANGRAKVRSVA